MERLSESAGLMVLPGTLGPELVEFGVRMGALEVVDLVSGYVAGEVLTVRHGLGRVPRGMVVVNQQGGVAPLGWWREAGDAAWTETEVSARWSEDGVVSGLVWVF